MKSIRVIAILLICSGTVEAQAGDTIHKSTPLFIPRDLLTIGAFTAATALAWPLDQQLARKIQQPRSQENRFLKRAATGFRLMGEPGSTVVAASLYVIGRRGGNAHVEDIGLHAAESILLADLVTGAIKVVAGRARPEVDVNNPRDFQLFRGWKGSAFQSFPSGHTTSAFAFAATMSSELARWQPGTRWTAGPIFYTGAALVGASRMYNNKHWASDVLAGAAIGTFVGTKVVRFQHSHPGNWLDRKFLTVGVSKSSVGLAPIIQVDRK
jgi:membrane-associated phospholipid phosphatase